MLGPDVVADAAFQLFERTPLYRLSAEHDAMDVIKRVSRRSLDDYLVALLFPLEHRAGAEAQLPPDLRGN
jgi:hypothetical protein